MKVQSSKASYIGIIIFLTVFAGISFAITFKLVELNFSLKNFINSGDNIIHDDINKEVNYGIKSLTEKYYTNNIEIIEEKYTEGELVKEKYMEYYPLEVEYIQIDGLKDEKIEEKVNKEIKEFAFNSIPKEVSQYAENKSVHTTVQGNFSNILSLIIYNNSYENYIYLNYDLTTGNQIKLEECFIKNAQVKNMISSYLYSQSYWYEFDDKDDKVLYYVYNFLKGNYSYYITPTSINLIIGNINSNEECFPMIYAEIDLENYYKEIAIFNRFMKNESIFTNEYSNSEEKYIGFETAENIYEIKDNVLIYFKSYDEKYREAFNDYMLNGGNFKISTNSSNLSVKEKYENEMFMIVQKKIENVLKQAETKKDLMHIYGIYIFHGEYDSDNTYSITFPLVFKLELKKLDYENNLREDVLKCLRTYRGGMVFYDLAERFKKATENYDNTFCSVGESSMVFSENGYFNYIILNGYYHPIDTSTELIKDEDLKYVDLEVLNILYNNIFAKYGHDFTNKNLKEYFESQIWYLPIKGKKVSLEELNDIEKQNLKIIKEKINELKQ